MTMNFAESSVQEAAEVPREPASRSPRLGRYGRVTCVAGLVAATGFSAAGPGWSWSLPLAVAAAALLAALPALAPFLGAAAGLGVYAAFAGAPFSGLALSLAAFLAIAGILSAPDRGRLALALLAATVTVGGVSLVLARDGWALQVQRLAALATALLLGADALLFARGLKPTHGGGERASSEPATARQDGPMESVVEASSMTRWRGWALVATAALIPVGEGAAFAAAGLLLLSMLVRPREVSLRPLRAAGPRAAGLALLAWIGFGLLAYWLGGEGWLRPRELGRLGPFLLAPLVLLAVASLERRWLGRAATAFVVSLAASSVVALVQFSLGGESGALVVKVFAPLSSAAQVWAPGERNQMVAGGFYLHRLKMAHVLLLGMAPLVARQLLVPLARRRRWLELALLTLLGLTLLLTYTRAALLGAVAGSVAVMALASNRWRAAGALGLAVAAAVTLAVPSTRERVSSITRPGASSDRALIWSQGVEIITEHPLGVGLGNYPSIVGRYYDRVAPRSKVPRTYPHDLMLAAWAEAGPGGLVAYLLMWTTLAWCCILALRRHGRDAWTRSVAGAGLFAAAAFWTVGTTHDVLFHKPVALAFAALAGAVLAAIPEARPAREPATSGAAPSDAPSGAGPRA